MSYKIIKADCLEWLGKQAENSFHAVVTDPPFGLLEFTAEQLEKRSNGSGGVWRIPPKIGGHLRQPLPRFTVLTKAEQNTLGEFFEQWAKVLIPTLVPGAHLFIATNPLFMPNLFPRIINAGFEFRGQIARMVRTLRGGDRPKNAEREFDDVTVMPRGCYEPWGLFRKPCEGKVSDNLQKWRTGGLRRISPEQPFFDVIQSSRTPQSERRLANHPSIKPQEFLRKLCYASLPLGEGTILDPFAGSGSTIAAAHALGLDSIGIEVRDEYVELARKAVPKLSKIETPVDLIVGATSTLSFA